MVRTSELWPILGRGLTKKRDRQRSSQQERECCSRHKEWFNEPKNAAPVNVQVAN